VRLAAEAVAAVPAGADSFVYRAGTGQVPDAGRCVVGVEDGLTYLGGGGGPVGAGAERGGDGVVEAVRARRHRCGEADDVAVVDLAPGLRGQPGSQDVPRRPLDAAAEYLSVVRGRGDVTAYLRVDAKQLRGQVPES